MNPSWQASTSCGWIALPPFSKIRVRLRRGGAVAVRSVDSDPAQNFFNQSINHFIRILRKLALHAISDDGINT
jgi:hypothetical protein